jgi:catechol 2,3-dioxygenase-like lactoylglutathione lyase family enzyme
MMRLTMLFTTGTLVGVLVAGIVRGGPPQDSGSWKVTGVGGVFFKARDPEALRAWYVRHLGFEPDANGTILFWSEEEEPRRRVYTVWSPFAEEDRYFEPSTKPFMFNFRVRNLDALLTELKAQGVTVDERLETYEYGRFGWAMDPEGNRIELWEPASGAPGLL